MSELEEVATRDLVEVDLGGSRGVHAVKPFVGSMMLQYPEEALVTSDRIELPNRRTGLMRARYS